MIYSSFTLMASANVPIAKTNAKKLLLNFLKSTSQITNVFIKFKKFYTQSILILNLKDFSAAYLKDLEEAMWFKRQACIRFESNIWIRKE